MNPFNSRVDVLRRQSILGIIANMHMGFLVFEAYATMNISPIFDRGSLIHAVG